MVGRLLHADARRIEELRGRYAADAEAVAVLDQHAKELAMRRAHSESYAYEFFVARGAPSRPAGAAA